MSFLKKIAKQQSEISIAQIIAANVGGFEKARVNNPLHASDLTREVEFCPREVVLTELLGVKRPDQLINTCLRITFDEGIDKQARLNNDYLRFAMVGHWRCMACGHVKQFQKAPVSACKCGVAERWKYQEVMFTHAAAGFTGAVDSLLDVGQPGLRMVECKIMGQEQWVELKAPLAEHKLRTNLYLRLIAESKEDGWAKQINTDVSHVLYWLRGHGKKGDDGKISPFKEYRVHRKDSDTDYLIERARAVYEFRDPAAKGDNLAVPKPICSTAMCARAEKCPVVKECFSGAPGVFAA